MTTLKQFLIELRRRRVIRVVVLYAIAGWIIVQVASTVLPTLHVPDWSVTLVVVLVALGLPLAAILAWAFDVGDDGLKRTAPTHIEAAAVGVLPQPSVQSALASTATTPPVVTGVAAGPAPPPEPSVSSSSRRKDASRHAVAVLPFANLTGDATKDYLGQGLAEELIHTLAGVPGLRVPARTSSFAYRGRNIDVRRIATELDVAAVLEGSVRAAGERIRITAQLIDGDSGYHLWSQHFDRRAEDLFELQDELAAAIILQTLNQTLNVTWEGQDQRRLLRGPPTRNLEAYQLYLEARATDLLSGPGRISAVFEKLQLALRLDPDFAQARAHSAHVRSMAIMFGVPLPGTLANAEHEARQALDGEPNSAATHTALGIIRAAQARWPDAETSFQQALTLDDANPAILALHAMNVLGTVGHLRACLSSSREAQRLAPAYPGFHIQLAVAHEAVRNDDAARTHAQAAIDLGMLRTAAPLVDILSHAEFHLGRYDAACTLMQEACMATMRISHEITAVDQVFSALAGTTDRAAAVAALDGLRTAPGGQHQFMLRRLILWYSMLGAYDRAYEVVNRSLDDFAATGTIGVGWGILWLRELAGFRQDARFAALAARMRLPDYWARYGPPDDYEWRDNRLIAR
jgi:TolB-like protein